MCKTDDQTVLDPSDITGPTDYPLVAEHDWCDLLAEHDYRLPPDRPDQTFRHSGWSGDRQRVYEALHRTDQSAGRRNSYAACGSHAYVVRSIDNPDHYRIAGSACHDRFCRPCAHERSRGLALAVIDLVAGSRIRCITLTLRHNDLGLTDALDRLTAAWAVLRKIPDWATRVDAGVAMTEVTYNTVTRTWHAHMHILARGSYFPHALLSALWLKATGDSPIVHIMSPKSHRGVARYVVKYATKATDSDYLRHPDALDEAIVALKGRRLCAGFGAWRGPLLVSVADPESWEHVGPLDDILAAASEGDQHALTVLNSISSPALAATLTAHPDHARPPPLPQPRQVDRQLTLDGFCGYDDWHRNCID